LKDPRIPDPQIDKSAVISPGCHIYGDVTIGKHSFVLFGAIIRAELDQITIGIESNIQDNAVLHCDEEAPIRIGSRVTVGHSAVIHGASLGERSLIGIGAKALNRSTVGEGAWLAAGSVLTEGSEIAPWTLAVGTPARTIRDLTEDEVRRADEGVDHYLELAALYREIFTNTR